MFGEWLRLAALEGIGYDQSGANNFPGRRSDLVRLARL